MSKSPISCSQKFNDRVEIVGDLQSAQGLSSAAYRFSPALPKPCIHPLTTPDGHVISGFEMSDHVWHRGLWFTIKFVNGTNFWEEQVPFGVQVSQAQPICEMRSADEVCVTHSMLWTSDATGPVMRERRVMRFGDGLVDWTSELHALVDVTLDRTPFTTWGGYGGLSFRASRELHNASFLLPSGESVPALTGQPHDWVVMAADVDGGANQRVSIGMIDHPSNPRTPSPWYCKSGNGFNYMNAAFLFHEPMTLPREATLKLSYRVLYRDGVWTSADFAELADAFRRCEK